jgi:VanZ family protein
MIIKHLSERNLFFTALSWTLLITILSLVSLGNVQTIEVPGKDKTVHFIFYFVLTILWYFALQNKYKHKSLKFVIVLFAIIYGIIIEALQEELTKDRRADLYDVFANASGAISALFVIFCVKTKFFNKFF